MIRIENRYLKILMEDGARICSVTDKSSGREILDKSADNIFCWLFDREGARTYPLSARETKEGIRVSFAGGCEIDFKVCCRENYMVFEVDSDILPESVQGLAFGDMRFQYEAASDRDFGVIGYAMTVWTEPCFYPNPQSKEVRAQCYRELRIRGAKYAVIGAPIDQMIPILKELSQELDRQEIAYSEAGGPWSKDDARNWGDYMIDFSAYPDEITDKISFCKRCGIDQIDFHQWPDTFRQGDFKFYTVKDGAEFKEKIAEPLKKAGIVAGLHTYSFYISFEEDNLLTDPVYQKQLEILEWFTLGQDIDEEEQVISTVESTGECSAMYGFMQRHTPYILLDQELIKVELGNNGFVKCQRGMNGTKAAAHRKGARIGRLGAYYNGFVPLPGTDLFYEVARRTARAYNEGGFGMIYFDALDGIRKHTEYGWYWAAEFVREVLANCDNYPIVEYAIMYPSLWIARGRIGAWDYPTRAYKQSARRHIEDNNGFRNSFNITTLGWYFFYPYDEQHPGNYVVKYQHTDDIDFLGKLTVIYDNTMVYFGPSEELFQKYPAYLKNMEHFQLYSRLRKEGYFTEEYKKKMRSLEGEHRLVCLPDGRYLFREVKYCKSIFNDCELDKGKVTNPYFKQHPFVRITGMGSSLGENPITLMHFDGEKPLQDQERVILFEEPLDISRNLAIRIRVRGTGTEDALCVKLSGRGRGVSEYTVKLDFEGMREFMIAEPNNLEFGELVFEEGKERGFLADMRSVLEYDALTKAEIFLTKGCPQVYLEDVCAVKRYSNPIENPSVLVDGQKMTFYCTLDSSEYIEYREGRASVFDRYGNERPVSLVEGSIEIGEGTYEVQLAGQAMGPGPMRAAVTFGFDGEVIKKGNR